MNKNQINRLTGHILIVLSFIALLTVLSGFTQPPQSDEGAGAHIFQLSIVAFVPMLLLFFATGDWSQPLRSVRPLAISAVALILAFVALYYLEHHRQMPPCGNQTAGQPPCATSHPPEFRNMNFPAPVAVLGFLAGIAGLALSSLAALTFLFIGKAQWTRWLAALVGAGAIVYFGLLFGFSLASHEATLTPGQEKYFCEIDCHLAYSVVASAEDLQRQLHVTLRTRFDPATTSPQRPKDVPLTPNPRQVLLIDDQGRSFAPAATAGIPLTRSLIPGESYETELTFLLPANASQPRLLITSPGWEERLLIGDENSFGHKKTFLVVPGNQMLSGN